MGSRPVILDTNFLLIPYQFKINIIEQLERLLERAHHYIVSSRTLKELEHISERKSKDGRAAKVAIKTIEANSKRFQIVESDIEVDDWIIEYAKANTAIVCTNDGDLRRKLLKMKVKIVTMKSKTRLGFA